MTGYRIFHMNILTLRTNKKLISRVFNYVRAGMLGFFLALLTRSEVDFYDFLCCVAVIEVYRNCSICVPAIEVYRNPTATQCGLRMSIETIARCSGVPRMPGVPKTRTCHNFDTPLQQPRSTKSRKNRFLTSSAMLERNQAYRHVHNYKL